MPLRLLNIILAFTIFISSSGLIINKHFCQQTLKNKAFFIQPMSCHELAAMPASCPKHQQVKACKNHENSDEKDKNCCQNESEYFALDQDQQSVNNDLKLVDYQHLTAISPVVSSFLKNPLFLHKTAFLNYKPPLIVCDKRVTLQTFLL